MELPVDSDCLFDFKEEARRRKYLADMFNYSFFISIVIIEDEIDSEGYSKIDKDIYTTAKDKCMEEDCPLEWAEEFKHKTVAEKALQERISKLKLALVDNNTIIYMDNETMVGYQCAGDGHFHNGLKLPLEERPYSTFIRWARGMDV